MSALTRRPLLTALVAGGCVAASMPPWGWWPLTFVGIALFTHVESRRRTARRRAFTTGVVFGVGWFLPAMAWMWFLTAPGYLIAVAVFAVLHGVASAIVSRTTRELALVVAPAVHTLVEALRLSFPFGGVPLATIGIAQVSGPLQSTARLGGVILLTWITWQITVLISTWRHPAQFRRTVLVASTLVVVIGIVAPRGSETGVVLDVVAVQGGGPQGTRAVDTDPREVFDRHLEATTTIVDAPDLVVWPENVIDVASFENSPEFTELVVESRRLDSPFLVGITEDVDSESFTNAQVVVTPDGSIVDRYDKVRRVPFGEYMPLRGLLDSLGAPVDLVPRDAVAGTGPARLDVPATGDRSIRAAVVISWEVFFGGRAREGVREDGGLLINPTNGSSYTWTILQSQQIASSRLRALETGRWVVQVSPTGFSAFVSPSGEVTQRTGVSETAVIRADVPVRTGRTWYVALGDRPWIIAVGAVALAALASQPILRSRSARSMVRR